MKKKLNKLYTAVIIFLCVVLLFYIAVKIDFYISFVRLKSINVIMLENNPCNVIIPVRYVDSGYSNLPGKAVYTADKQRFSLRYSAAEDKLFITANRTVWYGLTVFIARYEIIDSDIHAELLEYYNESR